MKIIVAIPIINEKKNIAFLLSQIFNIKLNISVIFIDDNSNDGSKELIENLKKKNKKIFLKNRKKRYGIGSAHKFAIHWAKKKGFDYIITIDGDCTHNPSYITKIVKKLSSYQIVNMTRFHSKKLLKGWSFFRIFLTNFRFFLTRLFLNTTLDSSSGYRGYNLKKININDILSVKNNSYFFLIESLFLLERKNYMILELPNTLNPRRAGASKLTFSHLIDAIIGLLILFLKYRIFKTK